MSALSKSINTLAENLGRLLQQHHLTCVTAESCTGGALSAAITAIPGASQWFDRGFVTYSNQAKIELLGVPQALLLTHGAVSEGCAIAMATGAILHSQADISVAITGIAGPAGGTVDKPVGTVWIAWAKKNTPAFASAYFFEGDRHHIREGSMKAALHGLHALLKEDY
ncbi:MAG: CinA family protein [Legionellaceae bacterium]